MEIGDHIGPFEIIALLGRGGMGEVYAALDRRLGRHVALKFLAANAPPNATERLQREARIIAGLNHPNICTLFEIGEQREAGGGAAPARPYLVLELLEGETLRQRLRRGPFTAPALAESARQIAEALDAAHRKGILHRDLKPENVWVGPGGQVKVLDFGLAQLDGAPPGGGVADSQAATALTTPGMALGTIPYMSPEQARGELLDARSDIFSFGAVYYEMATGRPPFQGRSPAALIAAILKDAPPPLEALRPELAGRPSEIARRCLEKDPDLRYQSAAEIRSELKRLQRDSGGAAAPASAAAGAGAGAASFSSGVPVATAAGSAVGTGGAASAAAAAQRLSDSQLVLGMMRRRWPWLAAAAVIAAAVFGYRLMQPGPAPAAPVPSYAFRQLTFDGQVRDAAVSPDGKFLAYIAATPAGDALRTMDIATGSDVQIVPPGPGCCQSPSLAPDDSRVYFLAKSGWIDAVPLLGGPVRKIIGGACSGAGLSPGGRRIAFISALGSAFHGNLELASADGADERALVSKTGTMLACSTNGFRHLLPAWSPHGRRVALELGSVGATTLGLATVTVANGTTARLPLASGAVAEGLGWAPDGRALLATIAGATGAAQLFYLPLPHGNPIALSDDLAGYDGLSAATSGALVMLHAAPRYSLAVGAPSDPGPRRISPANATYQSQLTWAPGGKLAFTRDIGGQSQLWLENADGSGARALVTDPRPTISQPPPMAKSSSPGSGFGASTATEPDSLAWTKTNFPASRLSGMAARWSTFWRWLPAAPNGSSGCGWRAARRGPPGGISFLGTAWPWRPPVAGCF